MYVSMQYYVEINTTALDLDYNCIYQKHNFGLSKLML